MALITLRAAQKGLLTFLHPVHKILSGRSRPKKPLSSRYFPPGFVIPVSLGQWVNELNE